MRDMLELLLIAFLSGSELGILILILQKLFGKHMQPSFRYYLWVLAAVRLLLPLEVPIGIGVFPAGESAKTATFTPAVPELVTPEPAADPSRTTAKEVTPELPSISDSPQLANPIMLPKPEIIMMLVTLWLAVAAILLLGSITVGRTFTYPRRGLRTSF